MLNVFLMLPFSLMRPLPFECGGVAGFSRLPQVAGAAERAGRRCERKSRERRSHVGVGAHLCVIVRAAIGSTQGVCGDRG